MCARSINAKIILVMLLLTIRGVYFLFCYKIISSCVETCIFYKLKDSETEKIKGIIPLKDICSLFIICC